MYFAGVHRQVLLVSVGWFLGYHLTKREIYTYAKLDREMNGYIRKHPEEFLEKGNIKAIVLMMRKDLRNINFTVFQPTWTVGVCKKSCSYGGGPFRIDSHVEKNTLFFIFTVSHTQHKHFGFCEVEGKKDLDKRQNCMQVVSDLNILEIWRTWGSHFHLGKEENRPVEFIRIRKQCVLYTAEVLMLTLTLELITSN